MVSEVKKRSRSRAVLPDGIIVPDGKGQVFRNDPSKESFIWTNKFLDEEIPVLHLELAGITYADKNYLVRRIGDVRNPYNSLFVIEYVVSGKGYIEAKGVRTAVKAGDLYIVDCRIPHAYYSDPEDPFEKKWLNIRGRFMNAVEPLIFRGDPYVVMPLGDDASKLMEDIHERIRRTTPADSDEMLSYVMKRILDLFIFIENYRKIQKDELSKPERIVRHIEQNICLDISVNDISENFYISSSTLYRMFKSSFGISPKDFIMKKKIEAAKRMIADNDSSISTIASALNFYDSHHFSRTFKKYAGMSPTQYKNELNNKETINSKLLR